MLFDKGKKFTWDSFFHSRRYETALLHFEIESTARTFNRLLFNIFLYLTLAIYFDFVDSNRLSYISGLLPFFKSIIRAFLPKPKNVLQKYNIEKKVTKVKEMELIPEISSAKVEFDKVLHEKNLTNHINNNIINFQGLLV